MPPALNERVETPTHQSRRTYQRAGAEERKCPIPTAHFMAFFGAAAAFVFLMAFVATNACSLAVLLTTFIAFIAFAARIAFVGTKSSFAALLTTFIAFIAFAARIAFAMTRREVSTTPPTRLKAGEMRS